MHQIGLGLLSLGSTAQQTQMGLGFARLDFRALERTRCDSLQVPDHCGPASDFPNLGGSVLGGNDARQHSETPAAGVRNRTKSSQARTVAATVRDGGIAWGARMPAELKGEVMAFAARLKVPPDWITAVMHFESKFKTTARNPRSGAVGLIQFMPDTARRLGTTADRLYGLGPVEQMIYVRKYFDLVLGGQTPRSLEDLYMAVFFPRAVGKPDSYVLFTDLGSHSNRDPYWANREFDLRYGNADGRISKAEAALAVRQSLEQGRRPGNFG